MSHQPTCPRTSSEASSAQRLARERDDLLGDLDLACRGAARHDLERVAVAVAAREVHDRVGLRGVSAQDRLGHRDPLEELAPVQRVEQPHASDGVGDRDLVGRLLLLGVGRGRLEHDAFRREPSLEPRVDGLAAGLQLAEPLGEPHEERRRDVRGLGVDGREKRGQGLVSESSCAASTRRSAQQVGGLLGTHRQHDGARQPAEVLDERDAQHDRNRPHLADGERRDLLVAVDESEQVLLVDAGVGVRDDVEQRLVDAREAVPLAIRRAGAARCRSRQAGPP